MGPDAAHNGMMFHLEQMDNCIITSLQDTIEPDTAHNIMMLHLEHNHLAAGHNRISLQHTIE
jgi:hypothetical protein